MEEMTPDQEMKMRCYNAMGHGRQECERLESAKKLYDWLTAPAEPKAE